MLPTSKFTDSETAPPEENSARSTEVTQPSISAQVVCDVAEAGAFTHRFNSLYTPVLAAFGGERLHQCGISGSFDLDRDNLIRKSPALRCRDRLFVTAEPETVEVLLGEAPTLGWHRLLGDLEAALEIEAECRLLVERRRGKPRSR